MNTNKLRGKIVERGLNVSQVAAMIGVDSSTLYRKLSAGEKITIGEAEKLKSVLHLDDRETYEIFLAQKSHECDFYQNGGKS